MLVHGGAWAIPDDAAEAHLSGVRNALEAGYKILTRGGCALDAVEAAVTVMEDDPTFDAGRGSFLTSDGRVQLDALLMDGGRMKAGGVACVERLRNPIQAARLVLEQSPHVYFVGNGAEEFARTHGMPLIDNAELVLDRERERLKVARERQAAGLVDATFSGLEDDKGPEKNRPRKGIVAQSLRWRVFAAGVFARHRGSGCVGRAWKSRRRNIDWRHAEQNSRPCRRLVIDRLRLLRRQYVGRGIPYRLG